MEKIRIKIEDDCATEYEKLRQLLHLLKIDCEIECVERESMSGAKYQDHYLNVNYDYDEVSRKLNRSKGKSRTPMNRIYISLDEIEERMKTETAEEIAKSLGWSRSTFFRRLAEAKKAGKKHIYNKYQ